MDRTTSGGAPSQIKSIRNVRTCLRLSPVSPFVRPSAASVEARLKAALKRLRLAFISDKLMSDEMKL